MADLEFKLYDTMTRSVKALRPEEAGHLKFYSCGPTVYSYAHIGNFRTFIASDLVVRTARSIGWEVTYVSNITDVGHLTQDDVADAAGEDKMARALKSKEGEAFQNVWDLARYYAEAFESDWDALNLLPPTIRPRATEHMREQILAIKTLIENGHAYETPTGVYFSVRSFDEYGKLSGNRDRENLQVGVRDVVQDENKREPADFALWKKDDKHLMQWYSPWGWGFPGWHIECSAMAQRYLGDTIDLHGGGEDLKFPHHECEIAQSEAATQKTFCHHWMHVTFLQVEGEKMSKSRGNFFTARDLLAEGFSPLALRFALLAVPYNKPYNFTRQTLRDAQSHVDRFAEVVERLSSAGFDPRQASEGFPSGAQGRLQELYLEARAAMLDDLNTSVAIAKALEGNRLIMREQDFGAQSAWFLRRINDLLGIVYHEANIESSADSVSVPAIEGKSIDEWIAERTAAKQAKDFGVADEIRDKLLAHGIELRDTVDGVVWRMQK